MGAACRAFDTPVTGGNVSFYNQTTIGGKTEPVSPTPTIGMLGLLKEKMYQTSLAFRNKGDMIYMIGKCSSDIASSEYLYSYHKVKNSPAPEFDLAFEVKLVELLQELAAGSYVNSMHDVSDGGLYIALLESAMPKNLGFDVTTPAEVRTDGFLFGEAQGRVVVTVPIEKEPEFIDFMLEKGFPFYTLGHVTKGELRIDDVSFGFISDEKEKYDNAIGLKMES
jgi:phosphoribosylformylglycinamidine synthase